MEVIPILEDETIYSTLNIICIAFGLSIIGTAIFFFNTMLANVDEEEPLTVKLNKFRQAYIIRGAMLEGGGIMATIIFLLTTSNVSIYVFIGCLLVLSILSPKKKEIKKALRLSMEESLKIDQNETVITNPNELIFKNRLN
jgi:hypothetical protein